jgi:molybdenum cofactor cytidylyltransferase
VKIQNICAGLLASGASKRFGNGNKLLAQLEGRALVSHAATMLKTLPFMRHVAICPPDELDLQELLTSHGFEIIVNPTAAEGQSASVKLAARAAIAVNASGVLIALGDMPFVPQAHFIALADRLNPQKSVFVVASRIEGTDVRRPPACFDQTQFGSILKSDGDAGARQLTAQAQSVPSTAHFLKDFDRTVDFSSPSL